MTVETVNATIRVSFNGGEAVVAVAGDLDAADRVAYGLVMEGVRSREPSRIVVDASELDFLSASIVHEFDCDDVTVVNSYGIVKRVLDIAARIDYA